MEELQYPIGKLNFDPSYSDEEYGTWIEEIASLPDRIREELQGISDEDLDTPYRPDGWTIREVIHHLVHSHMNAIMRVMFALSHDEPTVDSYPQQAWMDLESKFGTPLELSLFLLDELHAKMTLMYSSLTNEDRKRTFHLTDGRTFSLAKSCALYAWHSNHHLAHIQLVTKA